ncbi:MAG: hypothetical protein ACKOZT_04700 [Cyanobium sp.]
MRLQPLEVWIQPQPGPLLPQIRLALAAAAQEPGVAARPLRWAITAAEPVRGLRIEAMLIAAASPIPHHQRPLRPKA